MDVFGAGSLSLRMYPQTTGDARAAVTGVLEEAIGALKTGFDGVMFPEHHAMVRAYLPNPLQMAGIVLERCPDGWAAACPLILPLRSEALVAEEVAWLAALHPGRVGLGIASGYLESDFALTGGDFDGRVPRFVEQMPAIARLLRGDAGPLAGDPALAELAHQPVPLVAAASSRTAARRAAEHGLGVLIGDRSVKGVHADLTAAFRDNGGREWCIAMYTVAVPEAGSLPAEQVEAELAAWVAETGVTSLSLRLEGGTTHARRSVIDTIGALDRTRIFGRGSA